MSLIKKKAAVELFIEAFQRLKNNEPINIPLGSAVTQNNVAREAGRDPSALRADRYPELLQQIQAYVASKDEQKKEIKKSFKNRSRNSEERMLDFKKERDRLLSICHSQQNLIEELMDTIEKLKAKSDT